MELSLVRDKAFELVEPGMVQVVRAVRDVLVAWLAAGAQSANTGTLMLVLETQNVLTLTGYADTDIPASVSFAAEPVP